MNDKLDYLNNYNDNKKDHIAQTDLKLSLTKDEL